MDADLQIIFSFAVTMVGALLLLTAYFEAGEFELDFEEIEAEEERLRKQKEANQYRDL